MRLTKLSILALGILPALHAGSIYAWGVTGDPECVQTGNTCTLDGFETYYYQDIPQPVHAWITESTGDESATIMAASDMRLGESMSGYSEFDGGYALYGGTGYGFAQFQLSWNVDVIGAWGDVQVAAPGIAELLYPSNSPETGSAWSDPIPMLWGEPFSYSFSVAGGLENAPGDCCGGFDITAHVTDWRSVEAPPFFPMPEPGTLALAEFSVPEPGTLALAGVGLAALLFTRRRAHRACDACGPALVAAATEAAAPMPKSLRRFLEQLYHADAGELAGWLDETDDAAVQMVQVIAAGPCRVAQG